MTFGNSGIKTEYMSCQDGKSCCLIGQYICLIYDWTVRDKWKVTLQYSKQDVHVAEAQMLVQDQS